MATERRRRFVMRRNLARVKSRDRVGRAGVHLRAPRNPVGLFRVARAGQPGPGVAAVRAASRRSRDRPVRQGPEETMLWLAREAGAGAPRGQPVCIPAPGALPSPSDRVDAEAGRDELEGGAEGGVALARDDGEEDVERAAVHRRGRQAHPRHLVPRRRDRVPPELQLRVARRRQRRFKRPQIFETDMANGQKRLAHTDEPSGRRAACRG